MFNNILIATDNSNYSESIFTYGIDFAETFSAELKAIFVISQFIQNGFFYPTGELSLTEFSPVYIPIEEISKKLEEDGLKLLDKLDTMSEGKNIKINKQILYGFVDETIYEESKVHDLTIIGKYSHEERTFLGFLGSNTEKIMSRIEKTLLIVPKEFQKIKRILICYDGSDRAKIGFKLAYEIGKKKNCEITILSVKEGKEDINKLLLERDENIKNVFGNQNEKIKIETLVKEGDVANEILSLASIDKFDLVVMGAHGHRKIKDLILGTTSSQVVRKTSCAVLLAR
ncbi:MAG: universal stress protein [Candidatus Firestonebacteria bacterium]|nr:universal stress protein [Candidatus Firestonebacteria bacterium]